MEQNNTIDLPRLQWYPGHMRKAERLVKENLKLVDVVVELLDARIPMSSANPVLREIVAGKPRLVVLNKSDLAEPAATRAWVQYFASQDIVAVPRNAIHGSQCCLDGTFCLIGGDDARRGGCRKLVNI